MLLRAPEGGTKPEGRTGSEREGNGQAKHRHRHGALRQRRCPSTTACQVMTPRGPEIPRTAVFGQTVRRCSRIQIHLDPLTTRATSRAGTAAWMEAARVSLYCVSNSTVVPTPGFSHDWSDFSATPSV